MIIFSLCHRPWPMTHWAARRHRPPPTHALGQAFWHGLAQRPWRHELYPLLRLIDARSGELYPLGRAPLPRHEPLRIGQRPSLGFAPATIIAAAPRERDPQLWQVDIAGFGLFGANGPLPLHMTEYAYQRAQQYQDTALTAFADLFHHRLTLLFFRAWADTRQCVSADRPDNRRFDRYAASLIGIGQMAARGGWPQARTGYYLAGHLSRHPRNAEGLLSIIRHSFNVAATLEENRLHWLPLPHHQRLRLAPAGQALGLDSFLGTAAPDRQYSFALTLGPLPWRDYRHFLPAPDGVALPGRLGQLCDWVRHYVGLEFAWALRLTLAPDAYRGCRLGEAWPLGQGCWLGHNLLNAAREDYYCRPDELADRGR